MTRKPVYCPVCGRVVMGTVLANGKVQPLYHLKGTMPCGGRNWEYRA